MSTPKFKDKNTDAYTLTYAEWEALQNELERLRTELAAQEAVIRNLLPIDKNKGCWYCSLGSTPDDDFMHFDSDNIWGADQKCLYHPNYKDALATLRKAGQRETANAVMREFGAEAGK